VPLSSFAALVEAVYQFAPASLDAIVRDCVTLYHPMALEKSVTVRVDPSVAGLPKVEVDMAKMRDAVGYVLDNAIKYSHKNKEVRIYGELSGNRVRLAIEDFGQGIKNEERRLIFGRRYQGERSQKALYEEGEGMGLFHARLIVESHKGTIWCGCKSGPRSEASARLEGYLVWFTFELPIKQSDA
jgi:signal transduction histidine kinase